MYVCDSLTCNNSSTETAPLLAWFGTHCFGCLPSTISQKKKNTPPGLLVSDSPSVFFLLFSSNFIQITLIQKKPKTNKCHKKEPDCSNQISAAAGRASERNKTTRRDLNRPLSICDRFGIGEKDAEIQPLSFCHNVCVCELGGGRVGEGGCVCISSCETRVRPFIESYRGWWWCWWSCSPAPGFRLSGRRPNGSAAERDSPRFRFQWWRAGEAGRRKHTWLNGHRGRRNQR